MGLPWLDQATQLHNDRDYACPVDDPAICDYLGYFWRNWALSDYAYARTTVISICLGILIAAFVRFVDQVDRLGSVDIFSAAWYRRVQALFRATTRTVHGYPVSSGLFAGLVSLYVVLITLAPQPYVYPSIEWDMSPPIATRTGWISLGFMPFIMALGAKPNLVTLVTGISHERLQIAHRYFSYAMLLTAVIHTIAMSVNIVANPMSDDMGWAGSVYWWTGVGAIVALAWLTCASMQPIRHRAYELFKAMHFAAAAVFFVFLFLHCDATLSSWDYMIVAGAIYAPSLLSRFYGIARQHSQLASIEEVAPGLLLVRVPTSLRWTPSQRACDARSPEVTRADFFLRFQLGVHILASHPFNVAGTSNGEARFLISVRRGITARLAAQVGRQVTCWLDGPYGGYSFDLATARFDHLVLLAGGSGMSPIISALEAVIEAEQQGRKRWSSVRVTLSARHASTFAWIEETLCAARKAGISVSLHFTGQSLLEDDTPAVEKPEHGHFSFGRPELPAIFASAFDRPGSTFIAVSGPPSFAQDAARANSNGQLAIARGRAVADEVVFRSDAYSL